MEETQNTQPNNQEQWFDGTQFSEQMILALRRLINSMLGKKVATGQASVAGGLTDHAIAHGLGAVPNFISWSPETIWDGTTISTSYLSTKAADGTNFYVNSAGSLTRNAVWYAAIL